MSKLTDFVAAYVKQNGVEKTKCLTSMSNIWFIVRKAVHTVTEAYAMEESFTQLGNTLEIKFVDFKTFFELVEENGKTDKGGRELRKCAAIICGCGKPENHEVDVDALGHDINGLDIDAIQFPTTLN